MDEAVFDHRPGRIPHPDLSTGVQQWSVSGRQEQLAGRLPGLEAVCDKIHPFPHPFTPKNPKAKNSLLTTSP
jgi:hypothetical protein